MKLTVLAVAPLLTATFALLASGPGTALAQSSGPACAGAHDTENLCSWDGPHQKCTLDVERIPRDACAYGNPTTPNITGHKPMCFSVQQAQHIVFQSSSGRQFRVRRLVPIASNSNSCPQQPFNHTFNESDLTFSGGSDTTLPKASAIGCFYKLEIQFSTLDSNAPQEPHDSNKRRFECRDPHLGVTP